MAMSEHEDDLIRRGGWWKGTVREWQALTAEERENLAFKATGCECAYPSWKSPVDCLHVGCQIHRGEKPPIALTEAVLSGERENGWLRFMREEDYSKLRERVLKIAKDTEVYDPWEIPGMWQVIVSAGIWS